MAEIFLPGELGDKSPASQKIKFGKALQSHVDRRFGDLKLIRSSEKSTERDTNGNPLYRLEIEETAGSEGSEGLRSKQLSNDRKPNAKIEPGSTGAPPVPSGHWLLSV